jgi:hypothetical protein
MSSPEAIEPVNGCTQALDRLTPLKNVCEVLKVGMDRVFQRSLILAYTFLSFYFCYPFVYFVKREAFHLFGSYDFSFGVSFSFLELQ